MSMSGIFLKCKNMIKLEESNRWWQEGQQENVPRPRSEKEKGKRKSGGSEVRRRPVD